MIKIEHFYIVPDWPAPANIHAATTLRTGGVSEGQFFSLNPAQHVGDVSELVKQNRQIIKDVLKLPSDPVWLDQIHSSRVVEAINILGIQQQADASFTGVSGVVCAVMTADCLPLLVCSKDGVRVAAIHAGWRGLLAGVISNTVLALKGSAESTNYHEKDYLVWLGPAIGPSCFEIGYEVRDAFLKKSTDYASAFKELGNDKWLADIYQLARIELFALGIDGVYGGAFCTFTESQRFYSYRRDSQTGRMATLIWME